MLQIQEHVHLRCPVYRDSMKWKFTRRKLQSLYRQPERFFKRGKEWLDVFDRNLEKCNRPHGLHETTLRFVTECIATMSPLLNRIQAYAY